MKSALIPGGHQFAMLRAAGMISEPVAKEEEWRGITQLLFLERLARNLDAELPRVAAALERIRAGLLVRSAPDRQRHGGRRVLRARSTQAVDGLAARLPAAGPSGQHGAPRAPKPARRAVAGAQGRIPGGKRLRGLRRAGHSRASASSIR